MDVVVGALFVWGLLACFDGSHPILRFAIWLALKGGREDLSDRVGDTLWKIPPKNENVSRDV